MAPPLSVILLSAENFMRYTRIKYVIFKDSVPLCRTYVEVEKLMTMHLPKEERGEARS